MKHTKGVCFCAKTETEDLRQKSKTQKKNIYYSNLANGAQLRLDDFGDNWKFV